MMLKNLSHLPIYLLIYFLFSLQQSLVLVCSYLSIDLLNFFNLCPVEILCNSSLVGITGTLMIKVCL